jgi:AcrR family transcriptional regulator
MATKSQHKMKIPTKEKILKAALNCFAKKGIEQTKLIDIAEAAKVKHTLIIYHFKDFEQLCLACVEQVVHNFFQETQQVSVEKQKNADEHLEQFIGSHFRLAKLYPGAYSLWLHFYYKASIDLHYQKLFNSITLSTIEKLKSIIIQYCREKNLSHLELQIELIAQTIISQIIGQLILTIGQDKPDYGLGAKCCHQLAIELLKG